MRPEDAHGVRSSTAEPLVVSQVDAGSNPVEHPPASAGNNKKRRDAQASLQQEPTVVPTTKERERSERLPKYQNVRL